MSPSPSPPPKPEAEAPPHPPGPEPEDPARPPGTDAVGEGDAPPPPRVPGDTTRLITLLPHRVLIEIPWDEYAKHRHPTPTPPQKAFVGAQLLIVPRRQQPSRYSEERARDEDGQIEWDIAIWELPVATTKWKMWRMREGELSAEAAKASAVENGGITIARIATEEHLGRVREHLETASAPNSESAEGTTTSLEWTIKVIEELDCTLGLELLRGGIGRANDGLDLENLPNAEITSEWEEGQADLKSNVAYLVEHEAFTLVDQHLLKARCKWSAEAYPPCTLKLCWNPLEVEYYTKIAGSDTDNRKWTQATCYKKHSGVSCLWAVVLLPSLSYGDGGVSWSLALVNRGSGPSQVVCVEREGHSLRLAWYTCKGFDDIVKTFRGGILIGYCHGKDHAALSQVLGAADSVARDTILWAFKVLKRGAEEGLLIAPDQMSPLGHQWLDSLSTYLVRALRKRVQMVKNSGAVENTVAGFIVYEDCDIADERFMQLARECRRPAPGASLPVQRPQASHTPRSAVASDGTLKPMSREGVEIEDLSLKALSWGSHFRKLERRR